MSSRSRVAPASETAVRALARLASRAGDLIRDERLQRRWTLATLASRAGISTSHLAQLESGKPASLDTYARVLTALGRQPDLTATDPRGHSRKRDDEDFVHAAMGEVEARRLRSFAFEMAIDEPYQHYQFAGRADVVAWDRARRALLHIENRTRFPNVQEALGSFGAKRAYLGRVLAERFEVRGGWRSETHVIAGLWSSEVLHVIRMREETFRAACPNDAAPFEAWWAGDVAALAGVTSSLVLLDPGHIVRDAYRFTAPLPATRPRYRGYAEAAEALRDLKQKRPREPDH
jgi:transcriptional regulator with XRE-family HTH domain